MGGGRPCGTLDQIRMSNGVVVVPSDSKASSSLTTTASGLEVGEEACTMGGGRPSGTLDQIRLSNGMLVPTTYTSPAPALATTGDAVTEEACTMGGGRPCGTLDQIRMSNGVVVVPSDSEASSSPAPASPLAVGEEACTMGGGRVSGTPIAGAYKGGSAAFQTVFVGSVATPMLESDSGMVVPSMADVEALEEATAN